MARAMRQPAAVVLGWTGHPDAILFPLGASLPFLGGGAMLRLAASSMARGARRRCSVQGGLALFGGVIGFFAGSWLAHRIGLSIFDSQITIQPVLFPVIMAIAVIVTFAGSAAAIRRAGPCFDA